MLANETSKGTGSAGRGEGEDKGEVERGRGAIIHSDHSDRSGVRTLWASSIHTATPDAEKHINRQRTIALARERGRKSWSQGWIISEQDIEG